MQPMAACAIGVFSVFGAFACGLGCGGFKPIGDGGDPRDLASPTGADLNAANADAADQDSAATGNDLAILVGGNGPGPFGALPTGYCCTTSDECRQRNCVTVGATRMCSDSCFSDDACVGRLTPFHCDFTAHQCVPNQVGYACVPAAQFQFGKKQLGECCTATHDGNAGNECEGGSCGSFGAGGNPYLCTNACTRDSQCPGLYSCMSGGDNYALCWPDADPYTCR